MFLPSQPRQIRVRLERVNGMDRTELLRKNNYDPATSGEGLLYGQRRGQHATVPHHAAHLPPARAGRLDIHEVGLPRRWYAGLEIRGFG